MERNRILDRIVKYLYDSPDILACWEGGSTAFGANDALSDIDLQVLVIDGTVERTREGLERLLAARPGIACSYEPPQPIWHGHWQAFYLFDDTSPFHMLDLLIIRESAPDRFLQRERHGEARVLFDRGGFCQQSPFDQDAHLVRLRQKREVHIAAFRVLHWLVDKEIQRGRPIDALHFYQSLLARVVELARMRHCPDRFDFGGRYLRRDLPPPVYERLEALYYVRDLEDLALKKKELMQLFESLTLRAGASGSDMPGEAGRIN